MSSAIPGAWIAGESQHGLQGVSMNGVGEDDKIINGFLFWYMMPSHQK